MYDRDKILHRLRTNIFGQTLFCLEEIDSTSKYAMQLARDGAPEGTVVCAAYQTMGRGRLNRMWLSKAGQNLLMSIILRPRQEIAAVQKITLAAVNILHDALYDFCKRHGHLELSLSVKWPNDLLADGKKMAGILAESILRDKNIEALVLGFGINLNSRLEDMPPEIQNMATSVVEETNKTVDIERFLPHFLNYFEERYCRLERTDYAHVAENWKKNCPQIGKPIIIRDGNSKTEGIFHDINDNGYLVYKLADGSLNELISGEIEQV